MDGAHRVLTGQIIAAAIEVHKLLGPGLLESSYEECLFDELLTRGLNTERQLKVPLIYKGKTLETCYRLDLVVEKLVVVEVKAVEKVIAVHKAQVLTYLRHTGMPVGLILNFNTPILPHGIERISI